MATLSEGVWLHWWRGCGHTGRWLLLSLVLSHSSAINYLIRVIASSIITVCGSSAGKNFYIAVYAHISRLLAGAMATCTGGGGVATLVGRCFAQLLLVRLSLTLSLITLPPSYACGIKKTWSYGHTGAATIGMFKFNLVTSWSLFLSDMWCIWVEVQRKK